MKKSLITLAIAVLCVNVFPIGLGFEFKTTDSDIIGLNLRLAEEFELKPQLGFQLGDDARLNLILEGNYYLPAISDLHHYAGIGLIMGFWEASDNSTDNSDIFINGHYGLRYNVNDIFSLFGEVGINIFFDPFVMKTFRPALGCTVFLPNFY